jgi:membrane-bound serine protease (ClpP class)
VLRIAIQDEAITPVTARFVERALLEAEQTKAECLLIELNTPGGLLQSTQQIVTAILASRVPVVVYVSPSGGRAASAGLFITLSSHVAAMAPGTRIGAAHPVQFGGLPIGPQQPPNEPVDDKAPAERGPSAMEEKLVNDTEAWARGLAKLRGRNQEWVATAVTESRVVLASEAVQQGIVELEAVDLDDLLEQLDGREILIGDTNVSLRTADAKVRTMEMWWGEQFLAVISNPNVVMLLLMFGVYGILFELYSPGWGVAGTLGVVSLLLAFFGMSVLPVNYVGLALIVVALAMFAAEVTVTSYGALTVGGIVCLTLGGMMLVDSPTGFLRVSLGVLVPVAVATGVITVFLLSCIVRAHRQRVQTGGEALVDRQAVARGKFAPDSNGFHGQVFVHGEIWQARSTLPVSDGQIVRIKAREGLTLEIETNGRADLAGAEQT